MHADRPAPATLLPLSTLISKQINACPLILAGPSSHSPQHRCSRKTEPRRKKKNNNNKTGQGHLITPLCARFVREQNIHTDRETEKSVAGKSIRGTGDLPFDSSLSPSRSSMRSPAPTAPQNTTLSWISSAWLPACVYRGSARLGSSVLCLSAARPGRLCACRALRRAASASFVSRSEAAGSSQPTSAGLEGKGEPTLIQSNTGSRSPGGGPGLAASRAVPCRAVPC